MRIALQMDVEVRLSEQLYAIADRVQATQHTSQIACLFFNGRLKCVSKATHYLKHCKTWTSYSTDQLPYKTLPPLNALYNILLAELFVAVTINLHIYLVG